MENPKTLLLHTMWKNYILCHVLSMVVCVQEIYPLLAAVLVTLASGSEKNGTPKGFVTQNGIEKQERR